MEIDSILDFEIQELKKSNVTEIGYTKLTCLNFGVSSTVYLFWKQENSTYIQKFKNSEYHKNSIEKFKPIEIQDSIFFNFYRNNINTLKEENAEHFKYKPDSIVGNTIYSGRILIDHSCYRHFIIRTDNEKFHKQFNHFDLEEFNEKKVYASNRTEKDMKEWKDRGWELETDTIFENHPIKNIHFESNNNLKIVEWDKLLTEFIDKMESENKFKEIKTE